jgi:hypothetical protein
VFGIRDTRSRRKKPFPDPGSRVKKVPDPGSPTLLECPGKQIKLSDTFIVKCKIITDRTTWSLKKYLRHINTARVLQI